MKGGFDGQKLRVKDMLNALASKIHLSFDLWTLRNRYGIWSGCALYEGVSGLRYAYPPQSGRIISR